MDFDIIVVSSKNRKALVVDYLKEIPHQVSITPNYDLPKNFKPKTQTLVQNHLGAYRCFRGHQDALRMSRKENILILEDDAVPIVSNQKDMLSNLYEGIELLSHFDMVSFHGRQFKFSHFKVVVGNSKFLQPALFEPWVVAALAYMVNRRSIKKLMSYKYDGTPWDILLYRKFYYCLMKESIFLHDRQEGSLIDV